MRKPNLKKEKSRFEAIISIITFRGTVQKKPERMKMRVGSRDVILPNRIVFYGIL